MTRRNPLANQTNAVTLASDAGVDLAPALRYDYDLIAEEHRSPVMLAARRIKMKGNRIRTDLIDIGRELTEAKQRLPHGQFGDWLAVEFEMSDRSARRYMRIYEGWGDNPEAISLLSDKALYLLADPDTPEEAKQEAIETALTTGRSPTAKETREIIAAHKPPPPPPPPMTIDMPLGLRALDTMATPTEDDEEGPSPGNTDSAGVIDTHSDDLDDTAHDDDKQHQPGTVTHQPGLVDHEVGALRHLVTIEAHIWRIALLQVGHDLTKLHQWISEHDRPIHYHTDTVHHIDRPTFNEAYDIVRQEIASKYDYGSHPLLLPPDEEEPNDQPANEMERHNWRINQISAALTHIQLMDFSQYSNITGDWTSPRKLADIADTMVRKLEGNLR
ncbi:MAG: hypothetical protein DCC55_22490 [Chloroflexi bacterium]|nr:MAG: hypothetical protein DCC55_22490 [Chloroflexota bacterium]